MRALPLIMGVLLCASACSGDPWAEEPDSPRPEETLTVFAAASLNRSFTELGERFEAEREGVTVRFNFAGSSDLAAQIQQGAPADVFASADTKSMEVAFTADLLDAPATNFATNMLTIATPPGNPAKVDSLDDLSRSGVKVVLCAEQVPCGSAAKNVEEASGLDIRPVSEEQSVADVLGKVVSGEADAGLVYVTDVRAAGDKVNGVPFAASVEAVNTYPIAALKGNVGDGLAEDFISFVTGSEGQALLAAAGFGKP